MRPVYFFIWMAVSTSAIANELQELRNKLESRDSAITSLHTFMTIQHRRHDPELASNSDATESVYEIWEEGSRRRGDLVKKNGYRSIDCFQCFDDNKFFDYDTDPSVEGRMMVSVRDYKYISPSQKVIDSRHVGLFPTFARNTVSLTIAGVFSTETPNTVIVTKSELSGKPCHVIEWDAMYPATRMRCYLYDGLEHEVAKIQQEWTTGKIRFVETCVSQYDATDMVEVRLPKSVKYTQHINDRLVIDETLLLEVATLNQPITSKTFSLEGVPGLEPGTPVQWVSDDPRPEGLGEMIWNGTSVVTAQGPVKAAVPISPERKLFVYFNCALLFGGMALILFRRLQQKKASIK